MYLGAKAPLTARSETSLKKQLCLHKTIESESCDLDTDLDPVR